ncbi:MAG: transcriptional repressor [Deltaproteobacteria bacterium]|nr:transcriptional repressor [Deltaproteobacteria bacterium]
MHHDHDEDEVPAHGPQEHVVLLRRAGLRVTASRLAVLELLERAPEPMTHHDVVERLHGSPWNRSTLYRNLIDLTEAGLLAKSEIGGLMRFERLGRDNACATHPHFVCTACGTVTHLDDVVVRVEGHGPRSLASGAVEVQLRGQCDACAG